jgi:diacylglycerol kinase family enzyme
MVTRQPHQNQQLQYFTAKKSLKIHTQGKERPVDIDGDLAGYTPVNITVHPAAIAACIPPSVETAKPL